MDRERIERQLKLAAQNLADCEKQMDKDKVAPEQRRRQPKWRHFEGEVRTVKRRLLAVKAIEEREAVALERKNNPEPVEAE